MSACNFRGCDRVGEPFLVPLLGSPVHVALCTAHRAAVEAALPDHERTVMVQRGQADRLVEERRLLAGFLESSAAAGRSPAYLQDIADAIRYQQEVIDSLELLVADGDDEATTVWISTE